MRIKFVVYIVFFSLIAVVSTQSGKAEKTETTELVALAPNPAPIHREIVSEIRAEQRAAEQARIEAERVAAAKAEAHRQWHIRKAAERAARAATAPRPSQPSQRPVESHTAVSGDILDALARCESGGNPTRHSLNGRYHGAFQFLISTWQSLGYGGDPHEHSYATQKEAARLLIVRSGWGQFPGCARKLGMRG